MSFQIEPQGTSASEPGAIDIALITRDPQTGGLLTGTCYVLVDYSNEGCDENGDGQVTFADIPFGTYTVRQTQIPAGYPTINDFEIQVQPVEGIPGAGTVGYPLGFIVKQAPEQNLPNTRNVSVHLLDMIVGSPAKLMDGICVELVGASEVSCDRDLVDGQIDFLDVPEGGPYEVRFSNVPAGFVSDFFDTGPIFVHIVAGPNVLSNAMIFVLVGVDPDLGGGNGDQEIAPQEGTQGSGAATMLMTFRACPEGFSPTTDDFFTNCTIPLDAPDASFINWGGDGQGGINITGLDRQYNGAYIYNAGPGAMNLELSGLAPVVRDAYEVIGADGESGSTYIVNLIDGETREVYVFYYFTVSTVSQDGAPGEYSLILGEWMGQHRYLELNPDGSGTLTINSGCCDGVTYSLTVGTWASPVTATIVDRAFRGDLDTADAAAIGDTITFLRAQDQGVDVLIITMPDSEQNFIKEIMACRPENTEPCV